MPVGVPLLNFLSTSRSWCNAVSTMARVLFKSKFEEIRKRDLLTALFVATEHRLQPFKLVSHTGEQPDILNQARWLLNFYFEPTS